VRIFKRETAAYWVDIYFFGTRAADAFNPTDITGVLRWSRIGPTQVQILTTNYRSVEAAAKVHESQQLEQMRLERQEQLATLGAEAADAVSALGGLEPSVPVAKSASKLPKTQKKGCRGCGKH